MIATAGTNTGGDNTSELGRYYLIDWPTLETLVLLNP